MLTPLVVQHMVPEAHLIECKPPEPQSDKDRPNHHERPEENKSVLTSRWRRSSIAKPRTSPDAAQEDHADDSFQVAHLPDSSS